jgi:hypothetical protein
VIALVILAVVGLVDLLAHGLRLAARQKLTADFQQRWVAYAQRLAAEDYVWLTLHEAAMATELGGADLVHYRAPFGMYTIQNLPLLSDTLIKLRTGDAEPEMVQTMDHILLRHLGGIDTARNELAAELKNPLRLVGHGLQTIVSSPLRLAVWSGLLRPVTARKAQASRGFRLVQFLVTVVLLFAAVETSVIGWPALVNQLRHWFRLPS